MSRNLANRSWIAAPVPPRCRCGHSRSYHRLRNDAHAECFASPLKAPPCRCAQYRPIPEEK